MIKFEGKNNYIFFTGVIEDRFDPATLGRVRVRCYGVHTDNKEHIATPDLPWAQVLMPTTSSATSGLGQSPHGLVEGATVMGFFRDGNDMQDPVVIGSLFGQPTKHYKIDQSDDKLIERKPTLGFNDPRRESYDEYDGKNPQENSSRTHGLTNKLSDAPSPPESVEMKLDGSGTKIGDRKPVNYPKEKYFEQSDVNPSARGDYKQYPNDMIEVHEGSIVKEPPRERETFVNNTIGYYNPTYPYNHVFESESGHLVEIDDTPDAERMHLYHRSGSRIEITPVGDRVTKIVNDDYEIILKDKKILIAGSADIELNNGNYNLSTKGTTNITATDSINITSTEGDINMTAKGNVNLSGDKVNLNSTGSIFDIF